MNRVEKAEMEILQLISQIDAIAQVNDLKEIQVVTNAFMGAILGGQMPILCNEVAKAVREIIYPSLLEQSAKQN